MSYKQKELLCLFSKKDADYANLLVGVTLILFLIQDDVM